jgi:gliding motility-associated-like protein
LAGCSTIISASVSISPLPVISANNSTICLGSSTILSATGATTYTWSNSVINGIAFSPSVTSTYTVNGTNMFGCVNSTTSNVTVNPNPTITIPIGAICPGGSFTLTPIGATSYTYSSGTQLVSPITTTSYTVTGSNASGCTNTAVCTISVNPNPTVTVPSGTICQGSSFTITPIGATSYTYSSGNPVVSPITTASYTVIGSNASGCTNTAVCMVSVNPNPIVTVPSGTICQGSSFTMTPTGTTSYAYSSGTAIVSPITTTSYTVTGSNASGCTNTAVCTVSVNPNPTVTVPSGTICQGSSFTMNPTGATSYTYSSGTAIVSPAITTNYIVTGNDALGCTNTTVCTVSVVPTPFVSVNSPTICSGQTATLTASGASTYSWSTGSLLNPILVSPTASTIYNVTGTSLGCSTTTVLTVIANPLPVMSVNNSTICIGQTTTLTASGANSYLWNTGSTSNPINISPLVSTTYTVVGSTLGCTQLAISTVIVNPLPILNANSASMCSGQSSLLSATGANTYTWSPGTNLNTTTGSFVSANPSTSTTYSILGTDANGCVNNTTASLFVLATPSLIAVANPSVVCAGNSINLTASGALNYTWTPGSVFINSLTITPASSSVYSVLGENVSGSLSCSSTQSVLVNVIAPIVINTSNTDSICLGGSKVIFAAGGITYSWLPTVGVTNPNAASTVVKPIVTTEYTVTVSNGSLCSKTGTVKIVVNPLPIVYAGRDTTINSDEAYVLQGSSNVTNFGFLNPAGSVLNCNFCSTVEVAPKVTTCYILKGENNHQCVAYDEVCINVTNDYGLYIPNAFTPNGDQDNELFIPIGYGIKSIKLSIFDRWGMEIFKSHDNAIGWDGKYKEKTCEQGIYAFSVLVITNEGRKISKTGHLTLLSNNK